MLYLLALLIPNWNITVENTTRYSVLINWQNLTPVINKMVLHYIVQLRSKNGSDVLNAMVVNGSATYASIAGLSAYTEYPVTVVGVASDGQPYKSSNVTALTEEGGIVFLSFYISTLRCILFDFLCENIRQLVFAYNIMAFLFTPFVHQKYVNIKRN